MTRRLLQVLAFVVVVGSAVFAILLPPTLTCASMGYPEGTRCEEGRIDLEDHGPFVSVAVDRRYAERFGILVAGAVIAVGPSVLRDRGQPRTQPSSTRSGGAGL